MTWVPKGAGQADLDAATVSSGHSCRNAAWLTVQMTDGLNRVHYKLDTWLSLPSDLLPIKQQQCYLAQGPLAGLHLLQVC